MRVFILIQLKDDSTPDRVLYDVPNIIDYIKKAATAEEMVFRGHDGLVFGWFIRTDKPLRVVSASIRDSQHFRNGDSLLMFEIGDSFDGIGFSRQWTWLQRSPK